MRQVALYLVNRFNPNLILDRTGTTSTASGRPALFQALIGSYRRARDASGTALLVQLTGHAEPWLRTRAHGALMDLSEDEVDPRHRIAAAEFTEAALDGPPRFAVAHLIRRLHHTVQVAQTLAIVDALAQIGTVHEVPHLIDLLDDQPEPIVVATLGALGAIAPPAALARIESLASGLFRDRDIKNAARAAADKIRARGAGRGSLSLAGGEGGLSLEIRDDEVT